jgi:hypothetical protein
MAPFFEIFFEIFRSDFRKQFYGVFGLPMQRNGQKRDKKNRGEMTTGIVLFSFFPQLFRPEALDMDFPQKPKKNVEKRTKTPFKNYFKKRRYYVPWYMAGTWYPI